MHEDTTSREVTGKTFPGTVKKKKEKSNADSDWVWQPSCDTGSFCSKLPLYYAARPNGKLQKLIYMEATQRIRMKIPGLAYKNTSVANKQ